MLSRRNWVTEFTGHVPQRGLSDDPDWVFDTASELHPKWRTPQARLRLITKGEGLG